MNQSQTTNINNENMSTSIGDINSKAQNQTDQNSSQPSIVDEKRLQDEYEEVAADQLEKSGTNQAEAVKEKRPSILLNNNDNDNDTPNDQPLPQHSSAMSIASTDDEDYHEDRLLMDDGILPPSIPLEALAGPALILPASVDIDGKTLTEEFDWGGHDDDDDEDTRNKSKGDEDEDDEGNKKKKGALTKSGVLICLNENSSYIAWSFIIFFGLAIIAVDVAIYITYHKKVVSAASYSLQLWFTWLAFLWWIGLLSQIFVELVPWAIKKAVGLFRSQSIEVLRMRLSYYMALRVYIKLLLISAWCWGSWAVIKSNLELPLLRSTPEEGNVYESPPAYVAIFQSIWECLFFMALFLFVEKFILQLIVTSFHKKAYGDRIKENDKALRVLDRLKKMKKKNPQEFLLKRIRRKNKNANNNNNGTESKPSTPQRSYSLDESNNPNNGYFTASHHPPSYKPSNNNTSNAKNAKPSSKSIMTPSDQQYLDGNATVKFPTRNMDTLIAIPPLEDRLISMNNGNSVQQQQQQRPHEQDDVINKTDASNPELPHGKGGLINKLAKKMKRRSGSGSQPSTPASPGTIDEGYASPPPLSRDSTGFLSRQSQDDHPQRGFLSNAGAGLSSTAAIPGKLLKGGYQKFVNNGYNINNHINRGHTSPSTQQAKYVAKRIYNNLLGPENTATRDIIVEADMYPFFRTTKEAAYAFGLFDLDGNGNITKRELRSGCIRIYRERKNLTRSMRDLSQATGKLDIILMVIFTVVWVIIVCAAFGVNVGTDLMPLWSAFVAASFIFGTSAKDAFEAIIFVFVTVKSIKYVGTHPFDAGDRVLIGTENWIVHNVGLLVTTFLKWDGTIVYAKNSVLSTQYIINVRRSGRTGETIELQIGFSTPSWKIRKIIDHMTEWCNQFPKHYTPNSASCNVVSFKNQNLINMSFYFEHTQNWQDAGGRWLRHNNFMMELKEECERLEISYVLPPQPYVEEGNPANDAPADSYNQGEKSSYGLDGMMQRRRPFRHQEDDVNNSFKNAPIGANPGHSGNAQSGGNDSGAAAGAASAMMFAATM
ncbi:hypothetical protein BDF20DRAFT_832865 [Mycotypha africana]|uniref:uncharacterized protein n=1 Tax=Mycotypha africana TaxID=64632 RepID=UPI0023015121|nr:uncharacterized protein BDF20DRAFT_832865 [Mycotypha africana]KAI8987979.1 hypothetical protein BDF20DRAFT_832865 [Mycotypha africana]